MPDVTITLADVSPDQLRSLRSWLIQDDELRGQVVLVTDRPTPGTWAARSRRCR